MALRMISRHWLPYFRPQHRPSRRLIIELTVSACHLYPYFRLYWPNRCFIRLRQRPDGGLSEGRPRSGGMIERMPCDRMLRWTHSASKSASASGAPIRRGRRPGSAPARTAPGRTRGRARHGGEDHVASAIDHEDDLRVRGVSRDLIGISVAGPPPDVVPAGVPRLQPGAVDGRQRNAPRAHAIPPRPLERGVEHLPARDGRQEPGGGLLEGG